MTGKEFLQQNYKLIKVFNSKLEQLLQLQDMAFKITSVMNKIPPNNTKNFSSRIETAIIHIMTESDNLSIILENFLNHRIKIVEEINKITNQDERLILEYRYLIFKSWREIANLMQISLPYVYKLHRKALQSFEKIFVNIVKDS